MIKESGFNTADAPSESIAQPCEPGNIPDDSHASKTLASQGPYNY